MIADRHKLRRQLHELRKKPEDVAKLAAWAERVQASCAQVKARAASVPLIRYDENLPIAAKRDEIKAALLKHQVLILAGETGSGKTTQLPKICLEIGRGQHGLIGHTQPRRIAARSVASRVAEELATPAPRALNNPKSALQEWSQGQGRPLPTYRVMGQTGSDHAPTFTVEVSIEGVEPLTAPGRSRQDAEKAAAMAMLQREGVI